MVLASQTIRVLGALIFLILAQLIPFIALDAEFQIARIIYTLVISVIYFILLYSPPFLFKYTSQYITLTSIIINVIGYISLQAFEIKLPLGMYQGTDSNDKQCDCKQQNKSDLSYDEQTIYELSINFRYFFGMMNVINFFPGVNKYHRIISLIISVVLWTFQDGNALTRLMSASFFIDIFLLFYHMTVIERVLNEKLVCLNKTNLQDNRQTALNQIQNTHQSDDQRSLHEINQILYQRKNHLAGRLKWSIDDVLYERDSIYEIVKKFANFNMVIYTSDMKMKFITQSFKNCFASSDRNINLEEEENIKKVFQKIIISEKENLYEHLKKTINQWYKSGEINSSFEMLCNRDRIYSLSNCQINLDKYQLYISEIQFDLQQCLLILFNTQEDARTFNQYKHKMINSISHDLKTPLNGMILLLDILKEQIKNNFLKPADQIFPSILNGSPLSANLNPNTPSLQQINLTPINKQNSSFNQLNIEGQLSKQNSQFDAAGTALNKLNENQEQILFGNGFDQNQQQEQQRDQEICQNEQKDQFNNLPQNLELMKNSHSDIVNIEKPKDFQHVCKRSKSQNQDNQLVILSQKNTTNYEIQQQQYVYNIKKQSFMNKYEPNMSTSLIPLQEEEEIFFEDQKKSRRDTLTDDDWFVQSSLKAATHNHLYHNNINNQLMYKPYALNSNSSSKVKKVELIDQEIKPLSSKQDSQVIIRSVSDFKINQPKYTSNQTFQEDSFRVSDKINTNCRVKIHESNHSLTEGQTITEHHPFLQINQIQTTISDNEDQHGIFQLRQNIQKNINIKNKEDKNLSNSQGSTTKSPDFVDPKMKQKLKINHEQFKQQSVQINQYQIYQDTTQVQDLNDENIQDLETDDAHNQVKSSQIQDNYLAKISQSGGKLQSQNIQLFDKLLKNNNNNDHKNPNLKIQLHKQSTLSTTSPEKSNLLANQTNDSPNYNLLFTPQIKYYSQAQKQSEFLSINQDFSSNKIESQQKILQQEKDNCVKIIQNNLQKKQISIEQNSVSTNQIQTKSNAQNTNNQSTNNSNKQISGSSPSSIIQGSKQQSQKQIQQQKSLSNTSISNQTPKSDTVLTNKEKKSSNSFDPQQQEQNGETIQRVNLRQYSQTPKNLSQFYNSGIESAKRKDQLSLEQIDRAEKTNYQHNKEIFKFDVQNEKDRITEIEEKSADGEQQSSIQKNNYIQDSKESGQNSITKKQNLKTQMQIPQISASSTNRIQYSKTTGSLLIPLSVQSSQRSLTYAYNEDDRKLYKKISEKKELKENIFNQGTNKKEPNQTTQSSNQIFFTNTTLRDIRILFQYISNIQKNGYLLESRINDLIDYSTLLNKHDLSLNCTQFDLMEILFEMRELFELQAKKKNCKLIIPNLNLNLKNDKPRIKQILINIIGNAIKFTFEGFIRILVQNCESSSNLIQIIVQDTGIGIPDVIKKNILNFAAHIQQVKDDNRQGVGIGLEICSRLCQIIGPLDQEIQIESKVNIGSSFSFLVYLNHPLYIQERDLSSNHYNTKRRRRQLVSQTTIRSEIEHENNIQIPMFETKHNLLAKKQQQQKYMAQTSLESKFLFQEPGETLNKRLEGSNTSILLKKEANVLDEQNDTILIVDDVAFNLIALRNTLKLIYPNLNILEAQNGKQAIEKVHENNGKIDLIIMDINMPIMDGFQAISIINQEIKDQVLEYVPIIAHTAFDNNEDKQKCFQLGAKGFLPKPVKKLELEKSIRAFLATPANKS